MATQVKVEIFKVHPEHRIVECTHCKAKQNVHVTARTRAAPMDPNLGNLIYDPNRLVLAIEDPALLWSFVGTGESRTDERSERNQLPILISALNS